MPETTKRAQAGIVHLRLIAPRDLTHSVLEVLRGCGSAHNIVRIDGASLMPPATLCSATSPARKQAW